MKTRIAAHIHANGPMPFDEYMEWCLYDPDEGFFSAGPVRSGKKGDFVTSPEISWAFGYCVGEWADSNAPSDCTALVEAGAGSGALLTEFADLWTVRGCPVYAVERSAEAQLRIAEKLDGVDVVDSIDQIPSGHDAVIVANEVLDNMPAALARRTEVGWVEIAIGVEGEELVLVEVPARAGVTDWCDDVFGAVEEGTTVTAQLALTNWISDVFRHFGDVMMCLIDYGGGSDELATADPAQLIRTYREHESGIDWLQHPGETDITVDVNFDGVLKSITRQGWEGRLMSQRDFLLEHGLAEIIADARDGEVLAASKGAIMHQLENRSERLDMEALIDPNGLGGFTVFLVE
jgi:SAM-dependent MidA family methyltransferase